MKALVYDGPREVSVSNVHDAGIEKAGCVRAVSLREARIFTDQKKPGGMATCPGATPSWSGCSPHPGYRRRSPRIRSIRRPQ
jgi:Alcohol dehydrogenase GroES-associated